MHAHAHIYAYASASICISCGMIAFYDHDLGSCAVKTDNGRGTGFKSENSA